ncbi:MAG: class I SAM-dependent methyltransferase [Gammaproteobacteria bacterium]|nr:MAG: class I SAM-dependent methyltransferase [Gammaproteobacteria bacterium]
MTPIQYLDLPTFEHSLVTERSRERVEPGAMLELELDLHFQANGVTCRDSRVVRKSNLWRDFFPGNLDRQLLGLAVGDRIEADFAPGSLTGYQEGECFTAPRGAFRTRKLIRRDLEPRLGRFYPRGFLAGQRGIFSDDRRPLRVTGMPPGRLEIDSRHPLAAVPVRLGIGILSTWGAGEEHGGICNDIAMLATGEGPGMQLPLPGAAMDFWYPEAMARLDNRDDEIFYERTRLVHHLDSHCRAQIAALYGRLIPAGGRVLDLMSSWVSHLDRIDPACPVTGLGMNREELDANPRLAERVIHDLNRDPTLPFGKASFDAVVCTASFEYLMEPRWIVTEIARVLKPGGICIITFSDRWFPTKAVQIWTEVHPFERLGYVLASLMSDERLDDFNTYSRRGLPRPEDDARAGELELSDPLFAVWARRRPEH